MKKIKIILPVFYCLISFAVISKADPLLMVTHQTDNLVSVYDSSDVPLYNFQTYKPFAVAAHPNGRYAFIATRFGFDR